MLRAALICCCLGLMVGCGQPRPVSPGQAVAIADGLLEKHGRTWGPPWQVVEPVGPAADGKRWIQLTYAPDPETGAARIVLVNERSGWVRFPPAGYRPRWELSPVETPRYPSQAVVVPGDQVLVITAAVGPAATMRRQVERLNRAALEANLAPLFSLLELPGTDTWQLIYGRLGDTGLQPDERILPWLERQGPWSQGRWQPLADLLR